MREQGIIMEMSMWPCICIGYVSTYVYILRVRGIYLKITHCSSVFLSELVYGDPNYVQISFNKSLYGLSKHDMNTVQFFLN